MLKRILNMLKFKKISKAIGLFIPHAMYIKWVKKLAINPLLILIEAQHGGEISGNMFYLLKELATNKEYEKYTIYVSCRKNSKKKIKAILDSYGIKNYKLVHCYSLPYLKVVASAKYLFNDNTFLPFFIKKDGQVYLNTWHGTPLKTLGKGIKNAMHNIGNTQKNFVCADYLLYPNEYTMNHMIEDYMIENISNAQCVLTGYPRNAIFLNKDRANEIRKKEAAGYNKVYAYMPTWRGAIGSINKEVNDILKAYLEELDSRFNDDEILFVNLHPIAVKDLDLTCYKHIKKFPAGYETYDFLNCTDCLITDYSSVFYDYAITGNKCVLFAYDEEEYFADRGVYMSLSDLPFPKVYNVDDLLSEIRSPKNYDDTAFLKEFCAYECEDAAKKVLDLALNGKQSEGMKLQKVPSNGKKNIMMNAGNLDRNGVTTAIYNLLGNVDRNEANYYICFPTVCGRVHSDTLAALPEGVGYFPLIGRFNLSIYKNLIWYAFLTLTLLKLKFIKADYVAKLLKDDWKYEIKRAFGGAKFDNAIQLTGYGAKMIMMFSEFDCKKTIYVHSDMKKEIETRGNQREDILRYAYKNYDNIALVTEDIWDATAHFTDTTDHFKVAHNIIAYEDIKARGEAEVAFDEDITKSNKTFEEVKAILDSDAKKIISVGRFSPEKDHKRMVDAFTKIWEENNDTYFIIIGGNQYNGLYDKLLEYVDTLPSKDHIVLILSMSNPMPIVKACDGFILASHYEGFGLVIAEADILGLPVVSTDITGPRTFMQKNNGTLVPNTPEGVEEGFRLLIDGKVPMLTTDYKKYNENAINEFYSLLD